MAAKALTTKNLRALLNKESRSEMTTSDIFELFLQISLVLLIVFIMMNVMFRAKAKAEVEEAKGKLTYYREKMEEIMTTEPGKMYEKMEKSLIDLQKQKLLNALDMVENQDRVQLSLAVFTQPGIEGEIAFNVGNVLTGDQISDNYFIEGCRYAKEKLPFPNQLANDWLVRVLMIAGMRLSDSSDVLISQNPEVVNKENEQWLKDEVNKRLGVLTVQTRDLQRAVLAQLQNYYRQNPDALKDTEVYGLIKRYPTATPEEQSELISLIREGLYQNAKSVFDRQNVPLLNQV